MGFNSGFSRLIATTGGGGGSSVDLTAVGSNIVPTADNVYDLGTLPLSWDELYVDSIKVGTGSLTALAITFGDSENEGIYSDPTNEEMIFVASGSAVMAVSSSAVQPYTNNTIDLGTSSEKWKDLYVDGIGYIDQLGSATSYPTSNHIGSTTLYGSIIPASDSSYDFGTATYRLRKLFIGNSIVVGTTTPLYFDGSPYSSAKLTMDFANYGFYPANAANNGQHPLGKIDLGWNYVVANNGYYFKERSTPGFTNNHGILYGKTNGVGTDAALYLNQTGAAGSEIILADGVLGCLGSTGSNIYSQELSIRNLKETNFDLLITEAATSFVSCSFNSGSVGHLYASGTFDFVFADLPTDPTRVVAMTLYTSQSSTTPGFITWDPRIIWSGGTIPSLTDGSGSIDTFTFFTSGSNRIVGYRGGNNMA